MGRIFGISDLPVTTIASVLEHSNYIKGPCRPYFGRVYTDSRYTHNVTKGNLKAAFRKLISGISSKY